MKRWSPYVFCFNNPIRFLDPDGMKPGDLFGSPEYAAVDFGKCYNGASIVQDREYGTQIYTVQKSGKTFYTYAEPAYGDEGAGSVYGKTAPSGAKVVGDAHTHGAYDNNPDVDNFSIGLKGLMGSKADIDIYNEDKVLGFVGLPNGTMLKYDPKKPNQVTQISHTLPSDSKDPSRKNDNEAIDLKNPAHADSPPKKNDSQHRANESDWAQTIQSWLQQNPNIKITIR